MGNAETKDLIPSTDQSRRELDLRPANIDNDHYIKHINGQHSESCLKEIPWHIRDAISLYEKLNVSFNCLSSFPPELPFRIPHLSYLDISHNQIIILPESIGLLFHLRELLVQNNQICSLPASITQLAKLKKLDLSMNQLEWLPEDMGNMKSLQKLNVSTNRLISLPGSLGRCPTLDVILAKGNECMEDPPASICEGGSQKTISFLRTKPGLSNGHSNCDKLENIFPRVRGNQAMSSVPNPHSARAQYVQLQTETLNTISRIKTPLLPPYRATTLGPYELRDKIIGLIYGAVIGDAIGVSTEFLSRDECQFHYEEDNLRYSKIILDNHRLHWKAGDWTSTSDQMFLVLDSLLHWGGVIDELDFAQRLLAWKESGFPELGDTQGYVHSGTARLVLQDPEYTNSPHSVAKRLIQDDWNEFSDNGALSRAIILGIPHFHDIQEVVSDSIRICLATHAAGPCWASASAISSLIALMLQGNHDLDDAKSLEDFISKSRRASLQHVKDKELEEQVNQYFSCQDYQAVGLMEKDKMSYAFKPLGATLVALRSRTQFESAISSLVMQGGHVTVNAAIAGAILGCKDGFSRLPAHWVRELLEPQQHWINYKINSLLDIMGFP